MLRPASAISLRQLQLAANGTDAELDRALLRLGVLAPAELEAIRTSLTYPETTLEATVNRDGHRVIGVHLGGRAMSWIHHDGRVVTVDEPELLLGT